MFQSPLFQNRQGNTFHVLIGFMQQSPISSNFCVVLMWLGTFHRGLHRCIVLHRCPVRGMRSLSSTSRRRSGGKTKQIWRISSLIVFLFYIHILYILYIYYIYYIYIYIYMINYMIYIYIYMYFFPCIYKYKPYYRQIMAHFIQGHLQVIQTSTIRRWHSIWDRTWRVFNRGIPSKTLGSLVVKRRCPSFRNSLELI